VRLGDIRPEQVRHHLAQRAPIAGHQNLHAAQLAVRDAVVAERPAAERPVVKALNLPLDGGRGKLEVAPRLTLGRYGHHLDPPAVGNAQRQSMRLIVVIPGRDREREPDGCGGKAAAQNIRTKAVARHIQNKNVVDMQAQGNRPERRVLVVGPASHFRVGQNVEIDDHGARLFGHGRLAGQGPGQGGGGPPVIQRPTR